MKQTHAHWMDTAQNPINVTTSIAVNTEQQRAALSEFDDIVVVGNDRRGPAYATNCLTQRMRGEPSDIVILVSDDFFSPPKWDAWLIKTFSDFDGAIVVDDSYQREPCITIPIMTYSTLLKLNRIVYHPSYTWQYADTELFTNLKELKCLRDLRNDKSAPIFEHRHWANNKRQMDANDKPGLDAGGLDEHNVRLRMKMPLAKRLS